MLHAIFEDAIRVSFDTHGSSVIPGINIEKEEKVKVPDPIEKEGYKFLHWYVVEEDKNSATGDKEVKLNIVEEDGVQYFNYDFTKDTIVHAKWQGIEVPFYIIFMVEKRPDQITNEKEKYEFLGSFSNDNDNLNLQKTKGISGSKIVFDGDISGSSEEVTSLDKEQFQSYLKQEDNTKNLLKYATPLGISENQLKGLHVNKDKTNEENPVIEGNGFTTKVIYLDRDPVNLAIYEGKIGPRSLIDDATTNKASLGGYKYGQILKEKGDRGWDYITKNYTKKGGETALLFNYDLERFYTTVPFAIEDAIVGSEKANYMTRGTDAWEFNICRLFYGYKKVLITIPFKLPADKQGLNYENALKEWMAKADVETLKNHLLPSKDEPLTTKVKGVWDSIYMQTEDYPFIDGYQTINEQKTNPIKDQGIINKIKTLTNDNSEYFVVPVIYRKQKFSIEFNSKAKGQYAPLKVSDIPYNSVIVGPPGAAGGDPSIQDKEEKVNEYMAKFVKAEFDSLTKEVTNLETVTKNQEGHLFMGWYLDPGYTIAFDEHMPMPAHNLQVFAKWEPLYHYVVVHDVPFGTSGVNDEKNINRLKIAHGKFIDSQLDIIKYPSIPAGRTRTDFQGWETYGNVDKEIPSPSGIEGGPFLFKFDTKVDTGFHLYPRWDFDKVGVVYAFNSNEEDRPLTEVEIKKIMDSLDSKEGPLTEENNFYMSKYQYLMDSKVRLRAPLEWNTEGIINEPVAPEGTKAHGKVFLGWKVMYRDQEAPHEWHTVDNLIYYNSELTFSKNNISHKSGAKKGEAIGVMVLVAQWGEKKLETKLTLHRNDGTGNDKEYKIENINHQWTLPNPEDTNALPGWARDKYQFTGWNTKADGGGKTYKAEEDIFIDEVYDIPTNHLYAQWKKYYTLEATKEWKPDKSDYTVKMGLLRWKAPDKSENPDFTKANNFTPVKGSLKSYKTDLEVDGKMKWEVPGLDEDGKRYAYVIVEVKPGMEDAFNDFTAWDQLNVTIDKTLKTKTQIIALTDANSKVDTFTSSTVRSDKRDDEGEIIGYNFEIINDKVVVPMPVISQPYADQNVIVITPGKESDKKVEKVEKIEVNLGNGDTLELTKDTNTGHFTISNNPKYRVTADLAGKLTITLPADNVLEKDQVITAVAKNIGDVPSEIDTKKTLDAQDSFKIEKLEQEKRDSDYNVVIKATIPRATTVVEGTTFTLTDAGGDPILAKDGQTPIVGTLDKDGQTVVFKVPDGILADGQEVKVKTEEPNKKPILSDLSSPLDIDPPAITASNIAGQVGVALDPATNVVTVADKDLTNLRFSYDNLPAKLTLVKDGENSWKINGAGKYIIESSERHQVTYTAIDKFGNKATKTVNVVISDKEVISEPVIDDISKGDRSVKITPPATGDTLVVTFPGDKVVTLTKDPTDSKWKDASGISYPVTDGKLDVPVPNDGTLNVGDIVKAQGKDSTGKLADSPEVTKAVGQSTKKTPTPQFEKITVGDKNFKIKPVDKADEAIITDKLVITIRDEKGKEVKKITLTKNDNNKWSDGTTEYTKDAEGYITVSLDGVSLTEKYSFGATGEDTFHGHIISDPTSINVNAKQSEKPTATQGESKENGNPTVKGTGQPGADISVYDPNGDLIAGPVKVDKEGNYEIELPKGSIPANGIVDVKQKEDGKPESEATEVTIDKTAPDAPVIDQPSVGDKVVKVTPPKGAEKMTITLPDGSKVELTKNPQGKWTDGTNTYTPDQDGKISLPVDPALKNNELIKATAADEFGNTSDEATKTVGNENSFATEKPVQKPRNDKGDVVIESTVPTDSNPADGTTYTLVGEDGKPIAGEDGKPITATPDKDGKLTFNVPDGILADGDNVKVKTEEPGKQATTTAPSEALDLTGPVITASDITGKVGVAIEETSIGTNEDANITLDENLPNNLKIAGVDETKTEWKISGKGEFVTTTTHKVVAVDKFGNKTEKTFTVTITNKDVVGTPVIDDISKGDRSVKITPPATGDTLVVTFPGDKVVTLTKDPTDGKWKDASGTSYPVTDGKLDVPVPNDGTLNVGDIVKAQGKDSTGKLADSPEVTKAVGQSTKKTPTPQFEKITVGDKNFKIKPVDKADEAIITDKLVITISNGEKKVKEITLIKTNDGWIIEGGDPNNKLVLDKEGYLTVSLDGLALTTDTSFGATGEDTFHGHAISVPTSINVNEEPSEKPTAEQGKSKENGNSTITGTGQPGADISVYNPTTGDLIAGPVKVDKDGNYEIEVPENALPDDGIVDVKQKEACKPESEAVKITISKSAKPLIPATTEVKVRKVWEGISTEQAPEVIVYLLKNGKRTGDSLKLNKQNNWAAKFKNLDTIDKITDQQANIYTVEEELLFGYKTVITGNAKTGFVITNTKHNEKTNPSIENNKANTQVDDKTTAGTNNPRTGDEVNVPLYMALVVVSGSLLLFMELKRRKKQKISEGEDSDIDQKNH